MMSKKFDEAIAIFRNILGDIEHEENIIDKWKKRKDEKELYRFLELRGWKYNEGEWINDEIPF